MNIKKVFPIVGDNVISIARLFKQGVLSENELKFYTKILGLKTVARFNEKITHMMLLNQLFEKVQADNIDYISNAKYIMISHTAEQIVCHNTDSILEITLKDKLQNARLFFSTAYNCVTVFMQMQLAHEILKSLPDKSYIVLLVLDLCFTSILKQIPGSAIMGEAGVAIVLSAQEIDHHLISLQVNDYGQYAKGVWGSQAERLDFQQNYLAYLSNVILEALKKSKLCITDISLILPHNVNLISWIQLCNKLLIPKEKVYLKNISKLGHCFGADPFINLVDALCENRLQKDDYYMMVSVGLGAAFAAAVYQY